MVPDVVTTGLGICVIRLSPGLDSLYYDVVVDDINSNIDYAHLHIGDYGLTYGALQVDFSPSISGHRIHGFKTGAGLSAATINKLLVSNLTLIVHTVDFPGGEIRGQVVRFARKGYTFNLEGEQVVPPVITSAYGSGILSVDRNDQNAHLMLAGGNLDQMASQVLINYEVAGQNGPMIFDLSAAMEINATDVSVDTYWDNDFTPAFDTNISGSLNNDSVYIDVRNETFAGGEIRGQIQAGFRLYNPTTAIQQFGSSNSTFVVAPNPVINQVTIQCPDQMEEAMELKITNIAGAIVFSQIIPVNQSGQNLVLDTNNFISGIYLLKISDSDTLYTAKFIKQ
ncbi:MAG: CHRD domain-containing protein [Bacteroidetes bacterium]|nr:CHRD domain-containing protein [Bacteroidota bacterium]